MGRKALAGWTLIALAGVLSVSIVSLEIISLVTEAGSETSETLPVIGFVPELDD